MELTFAQWQALEHSTRYVYAGLAAIFVVLYVGWLLYGFINDKEDV